MIANMGANTSSCQRCRRTPGRISSANGEAAIPARNSSESPGKKKPISRPVSAKRMARTPIRPNADSNCAALSGFTVPALGIVMGSDIWARAASCVAVSTPNQGTGRVQSAVFLVVQVYRAGLFQGVVLAHLLTVAGQAERAVDRRRDPRSRRTLCLRILLGVLGESVRIGVAGVGRHRLLHHVSDRGLRVALRRAQVLVWIEVFVRVFRGPGHCRLLPCGTLLTVRRTGAIVRGLQGGRRLLAGYLLTGLVSSSVCRAVRRDRAVWQVERLSVPDGCRLS